MLTNGHIEIIVDHPEVPAGIGGASLNRNTRRHWLGFGARSIGAAVIASAIPRSVWAGGASRTLVSIQLVGGADTNNLVVPMDSGAYADYAAGRGSLALPQSLLLPIFSKRQNGAFGMPQHAAEIVDLYTQGSLAVVANVGEIPRPLTKASLALDAQAVASDVFTPSGNGKMLYLPGGYLAPAWSPALLGRSESDVTRDAFTFDNGVSLVASAHSIAGRRGNNAALTGAVGAMALRTAFPDTGIGRQLSYAARLALAGADAGHGTQIVTVTQGGYAFAGNDSGPRTLDLFRDLSQALAAFYRATFELGIAANTTAFTWSEYGRALRPNSSNAPAPGWGSHHLVVGASVAGGEIYGSFPSLRLGGPDDSNGRGVIIPSVSQIQFAATHGKWLGVSPSELPSRLPGLASFPTPDLGFYGSVA